jgi:hypothetical protein
MPSTTVEPNGDCNSQKKVSELKQPSISAVGSGGCRHMVKPLKPRCPIRQADNVSLVDQLTAVHPDGSRLGHGKLEIKINVEFNTR